MLWLWVGLGVIVGVPVILAGVGLLLPRDHVAQMEIVSRSAPDRVWSLVSDVGGTARWRSDIVQVDVQPPSDGLTRFVEVSRRGKVAFELVSQEPPLRQVVRVIDDAQPFGGSWTWEIRPEGTGSRLFIVEAGFIKNPLFRVISRVFFPPRAPIEGYLRALARELGESATPREVSPVTVGT